MDPDANLREQLEICRRIHDGEELEGDAERLADLVVALDEWLNNLGALPRRW